MVVTCIAKQGTTMLLPGSYQGTTMLLGSGQGVGGLPLPGGILSRKHIGDKGEGTAEARRARRNRSRNVSLGGLLFSNSL